MYIIRVDYYYICIIRKQDDISICSYCLGQIIDIKKKPRARTKPCETPLLTSSQLEYETLTRATVLSVSTLWNLSQAYDFINKQNFQTIPQNSNVSSSILWFIQSEAFSRSQNIAPTYILLYIATRISFINLYDVISVKMLGLQPSCSSTNM